MWEAEQFSSSFVIPTGHCSTLIFFFPLIGFLDPVNSQMTAGVNHREMDLHFWSQHGLIPK